MRFIRRCLMAASYVLIFLGSAQAQSVTLGQSSVYSSPDTGNANVLAAENVNLATTATVQSLSIYVSSAGGQLVLGIYDASGPNGGPGALKASTASFTPAIGWNTAKVVTPVSLGAGSYYLAWLPNNNNLVFEGTRSTNKCNYYSYGFGNLPTKFGTSPASCPADTIWSFYATMTTSSTTPNAINGVCGSSNKGSLTSAPTSNLCTTGTASTVSGSGPWSWTCAGSSGGATATCSATKVASAQPVNGVCGTSNGATVSTKPTANLCTAGTASTVAGSGPWSWSCAGSNGGSTAACSDKLASTGATAPSGSDPTSGVLASANDAYANWKSAGLQSAGGIPSRTTICATVSPRGSGQDDTANIQKAVNACPAGQVVSLSAGTFTVTEGSTVNITNGITLRGTGLCNNAASPFCATYIQRTNGCKPLSPSSNGSCGSNPSPFIFVGPASVVSAGSCCNYVTSTALTADAKAGSKSLQVASASGFAVGQQVLLDEMSNATWGTDYFVGGSVKIWAAPDYRVQWAKHNPVQANLDDFGSVTQLPSQNGTAGCWFSTPAAPTGSNQRCDRATNEIKKIAGISGNTITFDSPITISYRVANKAQLSYYQYPFLSGAGIENISFSGADASTIVFDSATNSWAYKVECTAAQGQNNHYNEASCFAVDQSFRVHLEQFYAHDAAFPDPAAASYWIAICCGSSETLVQNGIALRANKLIVSLQSGGGNVVGYNYMDDAEICCAGADQWVENGINFSHYTGAHHNLAEGNQTHQIGEDDTHGNSVYNTYFRNYSTGYRLAPWVNAKDGKTINDLTKSPGGNGPIVAAETQLYTYWEAFVGNVLGYPGYSTSVNGWVYLSAEGGPSIFSLGQMSNANLIDPKAGFDTNGKGGTTEAHGNFDYLNNAVTWDSNYSNHSLPNSFFLSKAPSFFSAGASCTYPWPWVTPTGTAPIQTNSCKGSGLPAKARFDAGKPFTQP